MGEPPSSELYTRDGNTKAWSPGRQRLPQPVNTFVLNKRRSRIDSPFDRIDGGALASVGQGNSGGGGLDALT